MRLQERSPGHTGREAVISGRYVLELICDNDVCLHTHLTSGNLVGRGHKTTIEAESREAALRLARDSGWRLSSQARCPSCKRTKENARV